MRYVRSTGEPVLATVQGPSPRGEQYRTITYKRGAAEVVHDRASLKRLTAVQTTSPPPRPAETPVQPAEVLPPKGVRQLQSTLHAFFQPRVQLPEDPEGTDAIPLAGNSPPRECPPSPSDGCASDGSASDGPQSVHSAGSDSVHSLSEGQVINSDGEVVEEGDCPTTDEDSELDSDSEVVWAKSARGTWGLGHTFGDKLYFTRNIPEGKWIPKNLEAPTVAKPALKPVAKRGKQATAKPAAASASIPVADGQHVQLFKTMWDRKRKFYTVPVQNKGHAQE